MVKVITLAGGGDRNTGNPCGGVNTANCREGMGTLAQFNSPTGVAVDKLGNVYVADSQNNRIRKITPHSSEPDGVGTVITFAGTGTGSTFKDDVIPLVATFSLPSGVAVDKSNNVYVADTPNHLIRKITSGSGSMVSTFAGMAAVPGMVAMGSMPAVPAIPATFSLPNGVAVDGSNNVYVADTLNHRIRKITSNGVVTTLAGGGTTGTPCPGTTVTTATCRDGAGTSAQFNSPTGVAVDKSGNVYVADRDNHRIRKITSTGVVSTLAGTGIKDDGTAGGDFRDGVGTSAQFNSPTGVAVVDKSGNVYVADRDNHRIRKITSNGVVTTLAGTGTQGANDDTATTGDKAQFKVPTGVAVDKSGNVYVADTQNHRIRKIIIPQ